MKIVEIMTTTFETAETFVVECDRQNRSLTLIAKDGSRKKYTADDIYECLGLLRADFPEKRFMCKGARLNVHPSRMSSQMSAGLVAYELHLGTPSEDGHMVNIFDYEETDITNDIQQQRDFYIKWVRSLKQ
ncbi:hypothetical protein [Pseudomonas sp. KK4]|uniref:hypothetical protein n=1 Tax=Pseudomonas sp. KK4 TaxID=1855729 RepID=UPI00097BC418|nr:hypothetical protein [Pseudomonas sp. KK4]